MNISYHIPPRVTDAKWAMLTYHDYIQRGFDAKFNDKRPSIAFKQANKKDESIGNIRQDFEENVNIPKKHINLDINSDKYSERSTGVSFSINSNLLEFPFSSCE